MSARSVRTCFFPPCNSPCQHTVVSPEPPFRPPNFCCAPLFSLGRPRPPPPNRYNRILVSGALDFITLRVERLLTISHPPPPPSALFGRPSPPKTVQATISFSYRLIYPLQELTSSRRPPLLELFFPNERLAFAQATP